MARPDGKLFRQEALAKLDSLEDLDRLFTVATARSWLVLAAVGILIVAALFWAAFGSMAVSVEVQGILLRGGRVIAATSPAAGRIEALLVGTGDKVVQGQPLAQLEATAGGIQQIPSPRTGSILDIQIWPDQLIAAGAPVAIVDPEGEALLATLYADSGVGKKIGPGMEVQIVPEGYNPGEYGYLMGVVETVAILPSTPASMLATLGNELLVGRFSARGAPIQIQVVLRTDSSVPSGYAWSASKGPDSALSSGHPCSARIILGRSAPMARVFPVLERRSKAEP